MSRASLPDVDAASSGPGGSPFRLLIGFVILLWIIEVGDQLLFDGGLDRYGVRPRTLAGLLGVLFAPFLHGGFGHLAANSVPLLVLGGLVLLRGASTLVDVSIFAMLVGGAGIWLIGPAGSVHLGSSILVFGYLGYLLTRGLVERKAIPLLISGAVALLYGGALWGVLPLEPGVSWQGHLFGALGGALAAWVLARSEPATEK